MDRPDFDLTDHDLLIRMDQKIFDIGKSLEKLFGNGHAGLCETRGEELIQIRERLSRVESAISTDEIVSLRKRMGAAEDFRAWTKGAIAATWTVVVAAAGAIGWFIDHAGRIGKTLVP